MNANDIDEQGVRLKRTLKTSLYISWFYLLFGVILCFIMFKISNHLGFQMLILFPLFACAYGGILGYAACYYDIMVLEREIIFWKSIGTWNPQGILFGKKWYSWLFYLLIVLLLVIGIPIQMYLFLPKENISFTLFTFTSMFMTIGSWLLLYYLKIDTNKILTKIKDSEKKTHH